MIATRFTRTTWRLHYGGSDIEVVLNEGRVRADGASAPLIELELELKRGRAVDLFALAASIDESAPLRLGLMSKNERGYALAAGELGRPAKAEPVRLDAAMSDGAAFRAVALSCLRHFRRNEIALLAGRDAEALHQARVALRRLRTALTLFRHAVRGKPYREVREGLRWLAGRLGEARNLDVLTGDGAPAPDASRLPLRASVARSRAGPDGFPRVRGARGAAHQSDPAAPRFVARTRRLARAAGRAGSARRDRSGAARSAVEPSPPARWLRRGPPPRDRAPTLARAAGPTG